MTERIIRQQNVEHPEIPRSTRKPHNHLAGYKCERKHPLGGHLVVYNAKESGLDAGMSWDHNYIVVWEDSPYDDDGTPSVEGNGRIGPPFRTVKEARAMIKRECLGVMDYDWGGLYSNGTRYFDDEDGNHVEIPGRGH